jgi:acetyl esterase
MTSSRPRVDAFVAAVEKRISPFFGREPRDPVKRRRHTYEADVAMSAELGLAPVPCATEEHGVAVAGHPDARLRVYWPSDERAEPVTSGGLPMLVYFFGGGFRIADIDWVSWDATFRRRARDSGVIVVAGEYSLAPEVRFPAQPEQCWSIFEWAAVHARELGGDPDRIAVGGASSGGNLAAATLLMNRDRVDRPVRLQLLEVPILDLTLEHLDRGGFALRVPWFLMKRMAAALVRQYLGRGRRIRLDPYASPLRAPSLRGLPPTVIYTAEADPLRGDGEAYARALASAGVPTTCMRFIGQDHGSGAFRGHVPAADHLHRDIVETLRALRDEPIGYPAVGRAGA